MSILMSVLENRQPMAVSAPGMVRPVLGDITTISLMPDGLEKAMSRRELSDLLAFLSNLR